MLCPIELCELLSVEDQIAPDIVILFTQPIQSNKLNLKECQFISTSDKRWFTKSKKPSDAIRRSKQWHCTRCGDYSSSSEIAQMTSLDEEVALIIHLKMFHPRQLKNYFFKFSLTIQSQISQLFPYLDLEVSTINRLVCFICSRSFTKLDVFLDHANQQHI